MNKWFVLAVTSIIVGFIWFGARPACIRSLCQDKARNAGIEWWKLEFTQRLDPREKSRLQTEYTEEFYNRCLHDKGLGQ